jgi:lysophospholipase L1-like esterase
MRIKAAIRALQEKHPSTPVLLVEHSSGSTRRIIDTARYREFGNINQVVRKLFDGLEAEGVKNIYLLGNKAIDLDIDATVDGLHPNDIGMKKYADAYEKAIRAILHEPTGGYATTVPVTQSRDGYYDWRSRHAAVLALNKTMPPVNIILANSIIHYWGGKPEAPVSRGADSWDTYLEPPGTRNLGFGWDKIENVLWRVYHEELDGYTARHVVVMIGTNNLSSDNDGEIIEGLRMLVEAVKQRQPGAEVLLSGLLPRRNMENRVAVLNQAIARLAGSLRTRYINPGKVLLDGKGKIDESLFGDGLHPNAAGYQKIARELAPWLKN